MTIVKGIFDGEKVELLETFPLDQPHFVDIVIKEAVPKENDLVAKREQILQYAGMWADLAPETWDKMQTAFQRRQDFFSARDVTG